MPLIQACTADADYHHGDMTPETAAKWVKAASGTYHGFLNCASTKAAGIQQTAEITASITANDSVLTISQFPINTLAPLADDQDARILNNIEKPTFRGVLHPFNGAMQHVYTYYLFPTGEPLTPTATIAGEKHTVTVKWGTALTLSPEMAQKYGENQILPLAYYEIAARNMTGYILVDQFSVDGNIYNRPLFVNYTINKTSNDL